MARKSKTQIALCVFGVAVATFGTTMIEKQLYKLNFNFNFSLIILNLVEIIIFGIQIPLSFRKLNFSNFEANKDALKKLRFFFWFYFATIALMILAYFLRLRDSKRNGDNQYFLAQVIYSSVAFLVWSVLFV